MKQIVFTFDDGLESHFTRVAPFFKKHGFNATFYVSGSRNMWLRNMPKHLTEGPATDEQIVEIHKLGFEIGNHTLGHSMTSARKQIVGMEQYLQNLGIPKPETFCFPGFGYVSKADPILRELEYKCCRVGYALQYEHQLHMNPSLRRIVYHTPGNFIVYCSMILNDWYLFEHFKKDLDKTPKGTIPIVASHGFASDVRWKNLQQSLLYAKSEGYTGIAMKDISP